MMDEASQGEYKTQLEAGPGKCHCADRYLYLSFCRYAFLMCIYIGENIGMWLNEPKPSLSLEKKW